MTNKGNRNEAVKREFHLSVKISEQMSIDLSKRADGEETCVATVVRQILAAGLKHS